MNTIQTKDGRSRKLIRFHLDIARGDDYELLEHIEDWKAQRQFLPTIRKALWLFVSLIMGDLSALMELFPAVVDKIKADAIAEYQQQQANEQFEAMMNQFATRIERKLETVSVQAVQAPVATDAPAPQSGGLQPIGLKPIGSAGQNFAPPPIDDDEDMVLEVKQAQGDGSSVKNFLASMQALQTGSK